MKKTVLGIDIGKHSLHFSDEEGKLYGETLNNKKGYATVLALCKKQGIELVVLEASGGYERNIILALAQKKVPVALVEASRVRNYARSAGILAKTDKLDARVIAQFGSCHNPRPFQPQSASFRKLRELNHRLTQITGIIVQEKTRIDKTEEAYLLRSINRVISFLEKEAQKLKSQMDKMWTKEEGLVKKSLLLVSCPGVGEKTARTVLLECPELGSLSPKELGSLAGLAPMNRDSGSYRGKKYIRGGRRRLRNSLYMATVVAVTHNPKIAAFHKRLKVRKEGKVALVACMRKLLVCLNAMIRDERGWMEGVETS